MEWIDIANIVFACVTANHLGLVKAIESLFKRKLPVINCPKCSTFWCVLVYTTIYSHHIIAPFAISFLASYVALWLELFEGYIDILYDKLYEKIYPDNENDTSSADSDNGDSASSVPKL